MTERTLGMYGITALVVQMAKPVRDTKLYTLIKAYLVFHKGKKCTAKEISEWINGNNFCLNRTLVNGSLIGRLLYKGMHNRNHILSEVECETVHNLKYYWVN